MGEEAIVQAEMHLGRSQRTAAAGMTGQVERCAGWSVLVKVSEGMWTTVLLPEGQCGSVTVSGRRYEGMSARANRVKRCAVLESCEEMGCEGRGSERSE